MKKHLILSLIVFSVLGCQRYCPKFPDNLEDYIPYATGETLIYTNQLNDTLKFTVSEIWKDGETSYGCGSKCACNALKSFKADTDSFSMRMSMNVGENYISVDIDICNDNLSISSPHTDFNPELSFEHLLENRYPYRFNKVKIVKGKGITELWDEKYNCIWVKNE